MKPSKAVKLICIKGIKNHSLMKLGSLDMQLTEGQTEDM